MKLLFAGLALLLLTACGREPETTACDISVSAPALFTHAEAPDTITARAIGPGCDRAIALYAIHTAEGDPIWAWSTPMPSAFGDHFHVADEEEVRAFLTRWAAPARATTITAPQWPADAEALPGGVASPLDRATYEDIRARDLPMLCHLTSVGRETCLYWEPAAALALVLYERAAPGAIGE